MIVKTLSHLLGFLDQISYGRPDAVSLNRYNARHFARIIRECQAADAATLSALRLRVEEMEKALRKVLKLEWCENCYGLGIEWSYDGSQTSPCTECQFVRDALTDTPKET